MAINKDKKQRTTVEMITVKRHDGALLMPNDMTYNDAIAALERDRDYSEQEVALHETFDTFPWDGAIALNKAIEQLFGMSLQKPTPGFFDPSPPQLVKVDVDVDQTVSVPWGQFSLPGIEGTVGTGSTRNESGRIVFVVHATVLRKHEAMLTKLFDRTREILKTESIYRGKMLEIRFSDNGKPLDMPKPRFLKPKASPVIFARDLEQAVETNILTPIRHREACKDAGIPFKRGVLAAGPFGTGKTLLALKVAQEATSNGITFLYVREASELAEALQFAERYSPAVVFAEDVDRVTKGERNDEVNELLNTLDGIDNKNSEIMVILTSNEPQKINPAMRRPGRIDVVLEICPPDAEAASRLLAHYGKSRLEKDTDLTRAGQILAGKNAATIREAMERAKLEAIRRSDGQPTKVIAQDVEAAAKTLLKEQALFQPEPEEKHAQFVAVGKGIAEAVSRGIEKGMAAQEAA